MHKCSISHLLFIIFISLTGSSSASAETQVRPYLATEPIIANWLPNQPAPGDVTDSADLATYFQTRPLAQAGSPTLLAAEADDVLTAPELGARFSQAVGGQLDEHHADRLILLMTRVLQDASAMLKPLKRDVSSGGRVRPYVRFPAQSVCDHAADDTQWNLRGTGSYPSGHATYGWMWGLILSHIIPEKSDAIMRRAYDFGQSRLVCGFHYPSDLTAGRLAASALFARLSADPAFRHDLDNAKIEIRQSLDLSLMIFSPTAQKKNGRR